MKPKNTLPRTPLRQLLKATAAFGGMMLLFSCTVLGDPPAKDLFASGDFSEWTQLNGKPVQTKGWTIEDGVIHNNAFRAGDIITRKEYKNFDLSFEWKISEGGNSGVKYRTQGKWGLEYQILDDARHKSGKTPRRNAGSLYDIVAAPDSKPLRPAGEWNHSRIVADGNSISHWLNGERIVEIEYGSEEWLEQIKHGKFRGSAESGFGDWTGPILLQDHATEVWFRKVVIREL